MKTTATTKDLKEFFDMYSQMNYEVNAQFFYTGKINAAVVSHRDRTIILTDEPYNIVRLLHLPIEWQKMLFVNGDELLSYDESIFSVWYFNNDQEVLDSYV